MTKRFKVYIDSNNLKSLWEDNGDGEPLLFLDREDTIQGVDEVCDLLNEQQNTINTYHTANKTLKTTLDKKIKENEQLKNQLNYQQIMEKARIQSAIQNERTNLGKNALKQLLTEIE